MTALPEPGASFFRSEQPPGEPLTRESFERSIEAMKANSSIRPVPALILHPNKLAGGREAAVGACYAAWHLWHLADKLPWWAWIRRRHLTAAGIERAKFAEMMWATLGEGEERI